MCGLCNGILAPRLNPLCCTRSQLSKLTGKQTIKPGAGEKEKGMRFFQIITRKCGGREIYQAKSGEIAAAKNYPLDIASF